MKKTFLVITALITINCKAQNEKQDFSTIDDVVKTLYQVISGPAGERDWALFHHLFYENALMGFSGKNKEGQVKFKAISPRIYQEKSDPIFKQKGFYEEEIGRKENSYGAIAQIFSAYQFRFEKNGKVIMRGVNSLQLIFENNRWYITQLIWQPESEELPLPEMN